MSKEKAMNAGKAKPPATAVQLSDQLHTALREVGTAPAPGSRDLVGIHGISPGGNYTVPIENVTQQLIGVLVPAEGPPRVFSYGQTLALDMTVDGHDQSLVTLRIGTKVEAVAPACLANLIICIAETKDATIQFSFPPKALAVVLNAEPLNRALHRISLYARRSIF